MTYLHRRFWTDFISVAVSREKWQTSGLGGASRRLLDFVDKDGEARLDRIARPARYRKAAKEIERRLLVYTEEIHTEKGSHSKMLMTWSRCPKIRDQHLALKDTSNAKSSLERLVDGLNEKFSGRGSLPWRQ